MKKKQAILYQNHLFFGAEKRIFTPDIQEMHTTREYDGQEHRFYVKEYQLADHPRWEISGLLLRAEAQMYLVVIFYIQI